MVEWVVEVVGGPAEMDERDRVRGGERGGGGVGRLEEWAVSIYLFFFFLLPPSPSPIKYSFRTIVSGLSRFSPPPFSALFSLATRSFSLPPFLQTLRRRGRRSFPACHVPGRSSFGRHGCREFSSGCGGGLGFRLFSLSVSLSCRFRRSSWHLV